MVMVRGIWDDETVNRMDKTATEEEREEWVGPALVFTSLGERRGKER